MTADRTPKMREDAKQIIEYAIHAVLPDEAVMRALKGKQFPGRVFLVAAGKATWRMANAASMCLKERITAGVVITKYDHAEGELQCISIYEGGHPVPDENGIKGTQAALDVVSGLTEDDTVLFLLSGGGSALFEKPMIPLTKLQDITNQLLASGADIVEINTIRKRLSAVKGGKFAKACEPARVFSIVLSDIVGDPLDMIASGPACADSSSCEEATQIAKKYGLQFDEEVSALLQEETPKHLGNVETQIMGSVRALCAAAKEKAESLGYQTEIITTELQTEAKTAGKMIAEVARTHASEDACRAFIWGGETVVHLTGTGKGGRNQELALSAAEGIDALANTVIFSVGSDGTDGQTDAAGGIVDGNTAEILKYKGIRISDFLHNNNSYEALEQIDCLIKTGATGTNVNDVAMLLIGKPVSG